MVNLPRELEQALRQAGGPDTRFLEAADGFEAFRHIMTGQVDIIVANYDLPVASAADFVKSVRAIPSAKELPLAVVTRNCNQFQFRECDEAGSSLVIDLAMPESFQIDWLTRMISESIESSEPPPQDHDIRSAIEQATCEVMTTMLDMNLEAGKLRVEHTKPHRADVISSISVAGFITGTVSLFSSMSFARALAARLLDDGEEPTDEQIVDAIGEVTNMVAGNIKTHLSSKKALFALSSPSVTIGKEIRRVSLRKHLCFLIPFEWQGQMFVVEFLLVSKAD